MAAKKTLSPQEKQLAKARRNQEKQERFIKLANARMTRALNAIEQVRKLANRNVYAFNAAHVSKINEALEDAVSHVEKSFESTEEVKPQGFSVA